MFASKKILTLAPFMTVARPLLLSLGLLLSSGSAVFAEPVCRVMDPELQGSYSGGCLDGLAHGNGVARGTASYQGNFLAGRKSGQGTKTWPWGDQYTGEFRNDFKHGRGRYTWGAGSPWAGEIYDGEYVDDRRNGQGVYAWPSGDRYVGPWRDDVMTGPPTPMMLLRGQAVRAASAALARAGTVVCQRPLIGVALRDLIRGVVDRQSGETVTVRITDAGRNGRLESGRLVQAGDVVFEHVLGWVPC